MLKETFVGMSEDQTTQVVKWEKEQIMEKYFNCTTRPAADQRSSKKRDKAIGFSNPFSQ